MDRCGRRRSHFAIHLGRHSGDATFHISARCPAPDLPYLTVVSSILRNPIPHAILLIGSCHGSAQARPPNGPPSLPASSNTSAIDRKVHAFRFLDVARRHRVMFPNMGNAVRDT